MAAVRTHKNFRCRQATYWRGPARAGDGEGTSSLMSSACLWLPPAVSCRVVHVCSTSAAAIEYPGMIERHTRSRFRCSQKACERYLNDLMTKNEQLNEVTGRFSSRALPFVVVRARFCVRSAVRSGYISARSLTCSVAAAGLCAVAARARHRRCCHRPGLGSGRARSALQAVRPCHPPACVCTSPRSPPPRVRVRVRTHDC